MRLILILSLFTIVSCSSFRNPRQIKEESYDGLKFESLKRYDAKRLDKNIKSKNSLALCHAGDFEEAEKNFKDRLDKNLKNYEYWNQISTCYILKKKYTKAQQFLDLALNATKTKKQKAVVMNNFGVIHMENKNFIEAKEYFKKSLEFDGKSLTPKYNLSQIYLRHGLYNKAEKQLTELMNRNSKDIDFLNSMAHLKLMQKDYRKSLRFFDQIPQGYRSRDDVATNLAMTYYMLGQLDKAKQTLSDSDKKDSFYTVAQLQIMKKIDKKVKAGKKK